MTVGRVFDRRLVIVTGKGGVGKSTVAAALGIAAARRGLRTLITEVSGRTDVARGLGAEPAGRLHEIEMAPGLSHVTIDRRPAFEEYLREEVPGPLPAAILARSRIFGLFVDATPGMGELLTIGKVWELTQQPRHRRRAPAYDLVVLDGPATGQVRGLLEAPRTFSSVARVGPVARQGKAINALLTDPGSTAVIAVAIPEQMAVSETLDLRTALTRTLGIDFSAVIVNRVFSSPFSAQDRARLLSTPDDPAVRSARWLDTRAQAQRTHLARLTAGLDAVSCATLPFLFAGELGRGDIEHLAHLLDRSPV